MARPADQLLRQQDRVQVHPEGGQRLGRGDTVKVCPGTYVGPVTIKGARTGLGLRSVTAHGATIKATDEATFSTTYLVTIKDVDKVTVKGYLDGSGTSLTVANNTVTFAHLNFVAATGKAAILLEGGANGTVKGNTLNGPAAGSGHPSQPAAGIQLSGTGGSTSVRGNTIARFAADIKVLHANGGTIHDNDMTGGQVGLDLLDGDSMTIYANTSSAATVNGLYVAGPANGAAASDASKSTDNSVHGNDFRTNSNGSSMDCQGESNATVAASNGNTFSANDGNSSDPAALCDWHRPHLTQTTRPLSPRLPVRVIPGRQPRRRTSAIVGSHGTDRGHHLERARPRAHGRASSGPSTRGASTMPSHAASPHSGRSMSGPRPSTSRSTA